MTRLLIFALAGLVGQLVDGSLGMAYGITSTTLLLSFGIAPAAASASVHLAEIGTSLASGVSHWKFGNVDWGVIARIAGPGAVGAFAGATALSWVATKAAAPWTAALLLLLGVYLLVRFAARPATLRPKSRPGWGLLAPLGVIAGFADATGGGGWGPIATSTLLGSGKLDSRKAVGSMVTAEFVVTLAASAGFLFALGSKGLSPVVVAGLLAGGVVAAPVGAWLVRLAPTRVLGACVGGIVVLTNSYTLLDLAGLGLLWSMPIYLAALAAWATALTCAIRRPQEGRALQPAAAGQP